MHTAAMQDINENMREAQNRQADMESRLKELRDLVPCQAAELARLKQALHSNRTRSEAFCAASESLLNKKDRLVSIT